MILISLANFRCKQASVSSFSNRSKGKYMMLFWLVIINLKAGSVEIPILVELMRAGQILVPRFCLVLPSDFSFFLFFFFLHKQYPNMKTKFTWLNSWKLFWFLFKKYRRCVRNWTNFKNSCYFYKHSMCPHPSLLFHTLFPSEHSDKCHLAWVLCCTLLSSIAACLLHWKL